jgi:hypothetical protein
MKKLVKYLCASRLVRLPRSVAVFTAAWVFAAHASAQQSPYALFQYSTLTGSGNTINATQIPVIAADGSTIYMNMTLQFDVDPSGNLTVSAGYPLLIMAPTPSVSSFQVGTYVGPGTILGGGMKIAVNGPGVTDGGATEWTLAAAANANGCTYPASATWYVGPIVANPLAVRIQNAGITSTAWSYGLASSQCTINGASWDANTLIGVSQAGNSITIVSFTKYGTDYPYYVDQITYTLTQQN